MYLFVHQYYNFSVQQGERFVFVSWEQETHRLQELSMNCNYYFQYTGTTNNLLVVQVGDISSTKNATVDCTFLSGFTGSGQCRVQYGTDPTYMNLPYSAVSTETGTAGDTVSVVLRERLNSSTVYYYTWGSVCMNVLVCSSVL